MFIQTFSLNRAFLQLFVGLSPLFLCQYRVFRVAYFLSYRLRSFSLSPAVETFHGYRNWTDSICSKKKKKEKKKKETKRKAQKCAVETVGKAGYIEELKHLSRLQWRLDVPHHGRPSRSQGLTTRSAISAENASWLLTFSRRQTRGSLRDILRISWGRGSRYKEIEEDKEIQRVGGGRHSGRGTEAGSGRVGRQCCCCCPPRPARAAPARKLRASKGLYRNRRRRQPWKQN